MRRVRHFAEAFVRSKISRFTIYDRPRVLQTRLDSHHFDGIAVAEEDDAIEIFTVGFLRLFLLFVGHRVIP